MIKFSVSKLIKTAQTDAQLSAFVDSQMQPLAAILETEIKRLTPVKTTRLQGSIVGSKVGYLQAEASTNVEYAGFVEWGTSKMAPRAMFRNGGLAFKSSGFAYLLAALKRFKVT